MIYKSKNCALSVWCMIGFLFNPLIHTALFAQLEDVRSKISAYEGLYVEMEAKYSTSFTTADAVIASTVDKSKVEAKSDGEVVGAWNRRKYFARNQRHRTMGDGSQRTMIQLQAYDGTTTRLNHYGEVGNVVKDRVREYSVKPIYFAIPNIGTSASLSKLMDYMPGSEPYLGRLGKWKEVEYQYLGQEEKNNVLCEVVELVAYDSSDRAQPYQRIKLWLATSRNYLIAASESFACGLSNKVPSVVGNVTSWMEVEDGVYVPSTATVTYYDMNEEGSPLVASTRTFKLLECKLSSDKDDPRFVSVEMPAGKPVYTVDGGKIVDTMIDGKPAERMPVIMDDNPSWGGHNISLFWGTFCTVNAVLFALIVYLRLKTKRNDSA
jgi:hypothetical protein